MFPLSVSPRCGPGGWPSEGRLFFSDGAFGFLVGDPPVGGCPHRAITPLLSVSTTLSAKSSVMSFATGCPPCWRKRHSRKVHHPRTLDQNRNGRPLGVCTASGSGGQSAAFPLRSEVRRDGHVRSFFRGSWSSHRFEFRVLLVVPVGIPGASLVTVCWVIPPAIATALCAGSLE